MIAEICDPYRCAMKPLPQPPRRSAEMLDMRTSLAAAPRSVSPRRTAATAQLKRRSGTCPGDNLPPAGASAHFQRGARRDRGDPPPHPRAAPALVLIVTTFGLDTYVYEALRAGARRILQKLDLRDRAQAVIYAYEPGLIAPGGPAGE
jgi:hypothetical protein